MQVMAFLQLTVFHLIVTGWVAPMLTFKETLIELYSESVLILVIYHFFYSTDFVGIVEVRSLVGYSLNFIVAFYLAGFILRSMHQSV